MVREQTLGAAMAGDFPQLDNIFDAYVEKGEGFPIMLKGK